MNTSRKRNLQFTVFLLVAAFVAAYLCFLLLPSVFETWNAKAIDRLFLFRSTSDRLQPHYDDIIVHVDINKTTIHKLDNHYLNRSHHAQLIRNLTAMNVSAQLYDFIFAARSNDKDDNALINATSKAGNVYFGLAFELLKETDQGYEDPKKANAIEYLDKTKWCVISKGDATAFYSGVNPLTTFPALSSASRGLGYLSLKADRDGVFRRLPLLIRYNNAFYPSYAFRAICGYLGVSPESIVVKPGKTITMKNAKRPGAAAGHNIVIPIDRYGNMVINFIGPWDRMKHYNFADIFHASEDRDEMEMWREELSGKIIVISDVSTGAVDVGPVPTDTNFPLSALHANVMHTILTDTNFPLSALHANVMHTILTESFLRELSDSEMLLIELSLLLMILMLSLRFSSIPFSLGSIAVAGGYVVLAAFSFFYANLIFHIVRPLIIVNFAFIFIVVYRYINEEKERNFIRVTFGRYLSNEVVEELLGSPEGLKMSGESREVTFLVSDLRGFTSLSSSLSPNDVIPILNRYFERMVEIIARYRGTVDELQGDGILVFFGAPLAGSDDQERAIACAIEMQNAMEELNSDQQRLGLPELSMGIGINSGEVVVGNIGSEKRAKYGAIGTPINTAFRIESHTVGGQILISPSTYEKVQSLVNFCGTMEVQVKGIDQPVTLYDVFGMGGEYQVAMIEKTIGSFTSLKPPLPITCFLLEGKILSKTGMPGYIVRLAESAAEISLEGQVDIHSNLKILLMPQEVNGLSEVYAKVVSFGESDSTSSRVSRTLLHPGSVFT
ncbi:MAG: adenylate/guanylate cyclase domain-containing protein [Deltaproteobacteria bacterium]|nr:adenylate/guanylate cyclase domain-containing protein [Deltaproteobacteria bacterium]